MELHLDEFYALHPEYKPQVAPAAVPASTRKSPPKTPASTVRSLPPRRAKSSRISSGTRGGRMGRESNRQGAKSRQGFLCAVNDSLDAALKRREVATDAVQPRR